MNTLVLGSTRSGKSLAQLHKLKEACVVLDPHGSLGFELAKRRKWFVYDRLCRNDMVLAWRMLSREGGEIEQEERIRAFADILIRRRDMTTLRHTPLIEEWTLAVLREYMLSDLKLWELPHLLDPRHHLFSPHGKFELLIHLPPASFRVEVGGALRIIENVCNSPVFRCRCEGDFDFVSYLNRGGIIIVDGKGVSEDAMVITLGAIAQLILQAARRQEFTRKVTLCIDEAGLLAGGYEVRGLAELQKFNLDIVLISQTIDQFPREHSETIIGNCGRMEVFRCNSMDTAKRCADILGTSTLSADAHLRTTYRTRQVHDGYDTISSYGRGERFDDVGQTIGYDSRDSTTYRARYATVQEAQQEYKTYGMQLQDMQRELLNLKVGERYVRDDRVYKEYVPIEREVLPWAGLTLRRTQEAIEQSIGEHGVRPSLSGSTTPAQSNGSSRADSPVTRLRRGK